MMKLKSRLKRANLRTILFFQLPAGDNILALVLKEIIGRYNKIDKEPLFAEWFTGVIRIPKGKFLKGVNMGFGSIYEKETHIKIERGKVIKQKEISNTGKDFDRHELANKNLPGGENRFDGDDL